MVRLAAALVITLAGVAAAGPARVVSLNLCTDQLAMLIAAPGQLQSVSWLAADPTVSLMPDQARLIGLNNGSAEEVFLQAPDLVLAGTWSTGPTTQMLRRLGLRVETLPPTNSIADVRAAIIQMGTLLDQPTRAAEVLASFDAALATLPKGAPRQATTYGANGYTTGPETLSGDVMRHAGLVLLAEASGGPLTLEQLVMAAPELIVTGSRYPTPSRAEAVLDHPAFAAIPATRATIPDRDWICGLPAIASVARRLAQ